MHSNLYRHSLGKGQGRADSEASGAAAGRCRIGISGLVLPVPNKAAFPEAFRDRPRLAYYASLFDSLEINSSFYKTPMAATFEKWAAIVPDDFQFTVKLSRDITHAKDLAYDPAAIDLFLKAANGVGAKKGCLLMQFPPGLRRNEHTTGQLSELLRQVWQSDPEHTWRWAVEFRHASWYDPSIYRLLDKSRACLVLHDMPGSALSVVSSSVDFIYLRFHGVLGDYRGSYPSDVLQSYAGRIKAWQAQGKDVYVYFNNTIGEAVANARKLLELIR
jgi:uncharacterized protein YecE (DUF72 family)